MLNLLYFMQGSVLEFKNPCLQEQEIRRAFEVAQQLVIDRSSGPYSLSCDFFPEATSFYMGYMGFPGLDSIERSLILFDCIKGLDQEEVCAHLQVYRADKTILDCVPFRTRGFVGLMDMLRTYKDNCESNVEGEHSLRVFINSFNCESSFNPFDPKFALMPSNLKILRCDGVLDFGIISGSVMQAYRDMESFVRDTPTVTHVEVTNFYSFKIYYEGHANKLLEILRSVETIVKNREGGQFSIS